MIGVDTNVLTRALVPEPHKLQPAVREFLSSLSETEPGFITQVTLAELYWVLNRSYGLPKDGCLKAIRGLIETPSLEFDDAEGVVRALSLAEDGADFPDALIQGAMELFGIDETVTVDKAASQRLGWRLLGS